MSSSSPTPDTPRTARIGPERAAVIVVAALVVLAIAGLLPSITFPIK